MRVEQLPNNIDAERGIIGLSLIEQRIPPIAKHLATTDFYSPLARHAWTAFLELEADGAAIEPLAASQIVKRNGGTYGIAELMQTTHGIPDSLNPKRFVDEVKKASNLRHIMRRLGGVIESAAEGKIEISEIKREIIELESEVAPAGAFRSIADILETDVTAKLEDLRHGITRRISTGWDAVDKAIGGGLTLSDVLVVAAVTGGGKSAFVLQLAAQIAQQGIPVAFASGEMTDEENGARLLSQSANTFNLNSATYIPDSEYYDLLQWKEYLKQLPIWINSTSSDLASLSKSLRYLVEEKGVQVLVIDYLQLFKTHKGDQNRRTERIAEVSQELKRIAMEFKLALIEVVQFNREGAKALKPSLFDLADSSQIEKDASLVFIIDIDREKGQQEVTIRIEKGRNVGDAEIKGLFNGMKLRFEF